jgi:hypothetical protein
MIKRPKTIKMPSLNQQILQLQQQMTSEQQDQQQRQQHLRQLFNDKLSSWPVIITALTAGVLVHLMATPAATPEPAPDKTPSPKVIFSSASHPPSTPEQKTGSTSVWSRLRLPLLTHPLLTQGIWWCLQQLWAWGFVQELVRYRLTKSQLRHPPYS